MVKLKQWGLNFAFLIVFSSSIVFGVWLIFQHAPQMKGTYTLISLERGRQNPTPLFTHQKHSINKAEEQFWLFALLDCLAGWRGRESVGFLVIEHVYKTCVIMYVISTMTLSSESRTKLRIGSVCTAYTWQRNWWRSDSTAFTHCAWGLLLVCSTARQPTSACTDITNSTSLRV